MSFYSGSFYVGPISRMSENEKVDVSPFEGYRTSYEDVEEIVDDRFFVPSSVAVTQHSQSYQGLFDSSESLQDARVARLNASIRHPSIDVVDAENRVAQLKKITVEYLDSDASKAVSENKPSDGPSAVPNAPSDVPSE